MVFLTLYPTQLWGNVGTPVLGLLEFHQSRGALFGVKAPTARPLQLSLQEDGEEITRVAQSSPSALLLLLSFKEVVMTPGWLPLIFIFVPAGVLTVWHFAKSNSHVGCSCCSADHFCDSKVAPDSGFTEWAWVCVQTYLGSQLLWDHISDSVVY